MIQKAAMEFSLFVLYFVVAASILLLTRRFIRMPRELFRKMLHMACVLSVFVLLSITDVWYLAALYALVFGLIVYIAIHWLERYPAIMEMLVQRAKGEIKLSIVLVFGMMAILITVFWGFLGDAWKCIIPASVLAWGLGDAAAALIGKRYGTHPVKLRIANGSKTLEGSLAMCIVALISIVSTLLVCTSLPFMICLLIALVGAIVASFVELISGSYMDTITVPLAVSVALLACLSLAYRLGGAL